MLPLVICQRKSVQPSSDHIVNAANLRSLPKEHAITHGGNLDDASAALCAAVEVRADAREFRLMDGGGDLERPLEAKSYNVR